MKQICQPHSPPHDTGMAVRRTAVPRPDVKTHNWDPRSRTRSRKTDTDIDCIDSL